MVEALMSEGYDEYVRRLGEKCRLTEQGREYWMARDLLPLLGYTAWERFEGVIRRAMEATESAGQPVSGNFLRTVRIQATTGPKPADYFLSRYACYLIAINAESSKVEVGYAQTYFAMKTRQMEIVEQRTLLADRVEKRDQLRDANKELARTAKAAGVIRFPATATSPVPFRLVPARRLASWAHRRPFDRSALVTSPRQPLVSASAPGAEPPPGIDCAGEAGARTAFISARQARPGVWRWVIGP
jgi:BRO family protein